MKPIDKALHDLKSQEVPNISATAEKWNVHRSTLSRNWNGITLPRHHADKLHKCKLSPPQEKALIDYINKLSLRGIPPITQMVRNFVYDIAKVGVGKNWTQDFIRRHKDKLDSGFLRMMDLSRKKADNVHTYRLYFEQVRVSRYFKIKLIIK
jgi:Tc5 transposase DNA-binding domain